jgi:hypothetical protein
MIWKVSVPCRLISVTARPHRLLTLHGRLLPPAGFRVCRSSREVYLKHYTRFWRYERNQYKGFAYISYSHDEIFLYYDGPVRSGALDDVYKPDEFIYDAFDGLKPDLDKIQSIAIDIAFITPKTFLLFNMDPKMYTLICTKLTKLRKIVFVATALCSSCEKHAPILKELDHGPISSLLEALYREVSKKCYTLPNIMNKRDYYNNIWGESKNFSPVCPWKLNEGTADDSPDVREWQVLPRDVEQWNLSQLAENTRRDWLISDGVDGMDVMEKSQWLIRHNPTMEIIDWVRSFLVV